MAHEDYRVKDAPVKTLLLLLRPNRLFSLSTNAAHKQELLESVTETATTLFDPTPGLPVLGTEQQRAPNAMLKLNIDTLPSIKAGLVSTLTWWGRRVLQMPGTVGGIPTNTGTQIEMHQSGVEGVAGADPLTAVAPNGLDTAPHIRFERELPVIGKSEHPAVQQMQGQLSTKYRPYPCRSVTAHLLGQVVRSVGLLLQLAAATPVPAAPTATPSFVWL
ncbi:hypothetical protein VDGL01_01499 [Verticillium dahliae]